MYHEGVLTETATDCIGLFIVSAVLSHDLCPQVGKAKLACP
jgi:hypothetical protein